MGVYGVARLYSKSQDHVSHSRSYKNSVDAQIDQSRGRIKISAKKVVLNEGQGLEILRPTLLDQVNF